MADPSWVREYEDGELVPGTPYRVVSLLGAGGMGSVYEVEHVELGRRYVLKSLLRTLASRQDLIARMRNEWRALGKLQHPNIVDILNAGITTGDVPYYVMERLDGETVRDRLQREGRAVHRRGGAHRARHALRPRGRARHRHRPPRHQAGQRVSDARRSRQSPRFRRGAGDTLRGGS